MDNSTLTAENAPSDVKEPEQKPFYRQNEMLKKFIYIQHKSNINKFAVELGVARQYIWGIIAGRLKPSISMARKICDALQVQDTRLIFPGHRYRGL